MRQQLASTMATIVMAATVTFVIHPARAEVLAQTKTVGDTTVVYKVVGKCEMKADVYPAADGARGPAVMWAHGGALIAYCTGLLEEHERYIRQHFDDLPVIKDWVWSEQAAA